MNNEKWDEICFLLSDNVDNNISESEFEKNVVQALRVLDWKEYSGDVEIRPSFPVGASNKITPDFVIKHSDGRRLFVVEIKQPSIALTTRFQQQLFSYMRQLKLEYGILIGQSLQIFYDGNLFDHEDPILLETIKIEKGNKKGLEFVEIFSKEKFKSEFLEAFTLKQLEKIRRRRDSKELEKRILNENYREKIFELIKLDFLNEYDAELIDSVLDRINIELNAKEEYATTKKSFKKDIKRSTKETLQIELNPWNEPEFKRQLLISKVAYIKTFFKDGTKESKQWKAERFNESSGVLANLRSRQEFRNGKWQELGIERVYVSIQEE